MNKVKALFRGTVAKALRCWGGVARERDVSVVVVSVFL